MTIFERIKQMSVDELASVIENGISCDTCDYCKYKSSDCDGSFCQNKTAKEIIIEWLESEADKFLILPHSIEYEGMTITQYSNRHVWITKDGLMTAHFNVDRHCTDDELIKYVKFRNMLIERYNIDDTQEYGG